MSTIIYSSYIYHYYLFIIYYLFNIIYHLDNISFWFFQLAFSSWLGFLKLFFFCFGSLFYFALFTRCFLLLVLFDFSRRLFDQLCFLDDFLLLMHFGHFYSFNYSLLSFFPNQHHLLKTFSYGCSLIFLKGFLISNTF